MSFVIGCVPLLLLYGQYRKITGGKWGDFELMALCCYCEIERVCNNTRKRCALGGASFISIFPSVFLFPFFFFLAACSFA